MKGLTAALVCIGVLYAVDAMLFDGRYYVIASGAIAQVYTHW